MQYFPETPQNTKTNVSKVLLIGVAGGTGSNVVKGFLEQDVAGLTAITRKIDFEHAALYF
ncbi:hypothetical protein [Leptolyngbya sp. FACHB-261]|uniref:hypothetical protein n=1 Tax=Leptolyngbya sp. FACHB-261 TaxID=2692806 RepID=UPI00168811F4|nr:hypothetical protein [Leptolyngbya sp. FACHB-261]MBD2104278.1 hypothetical protein [Leptolyngbya sp. FACHB-261]